TVHLAFRSGRSSRHPGCLACGVSSPNRGPRRPSPPRGMYLNLTHLRRAAVPGIAAIALLMSACSAANESGGDTGGDGASTGSLSGNLKGGGATSQEKAQEAWKTAFQGEQGGNLTI